MEKGGCIYILTNKNNTTLYTGVSAELSDRVMQHKERINRKSFTSKYNLTKLVYYELFHSIEEAIEREKQIKAGSRKRKERMISSMNPQWRDLYDEVKYW
jgi:putative endonuclease